MANQYSTPGVYIQEVSTLPSSVVPVATAVPAFIGYTEKAGGSVKKVNSMPEFEETFGGPYYRTIRMDPVTGKLAPNFTNNPNLTYCLYFSMQAYFANGGGPCYVASAGEYVLPAPNATEAIPVIVESDLIGADHRGGALGKIGREDEPTLLVIPEASRLTSPANVWQAMLRQCAELQDRFAILDVPSTGDSEIDALAFRTGVGSMNLKYGAAYYPHLRSSLSFPGDCIEFYGVNSLSGDSLEDIQRLTAGETVEGVTLAAHVAAQLLAPITQELSNTLNNLELDLPPSPFVAGAYCAVDRNRGVWKAPANLSLNAVKAPLKKLDNLQQDHLNVHADTGKSINAIRTFSGKGNLIWGARTLAGNDNEWRYVNVRRLFIFIEESIKKASEFVVFEPNDANTWLRVQTMIENFLTGLWREGALAGASPQEAFVVKVGLGSTMTQQDILEGKMNIEIGIAAVRPAEFILLRFSHKLQES